MAMDSARIARRSVLAAAGLFAARPLCATAANGKPRVEIQTNHGIIVVQLEAGKAPITSANFLRYIDAGKYDGGQFYRASRTPGVPKAGIIEGGPAGTVRRFAPIAHESTETTGLRHKAGTISIARDRPGTATADFFICASPAPYLDAHPGAAGDNQGYAAFGEVVEGMAVVRAILALPANGKPLTPEMKGQMLDPPVPILGMKRRV
jgi:peptidyl-prolyl cis-trans isomerase A (cyclophilin A)